MAGQARRRIARAIEDHGPISFAEYMELALYGPAGYYEDPPVGPEGDFVTSPHVHPVFAELLARAVGEMRSALGDPRPFRLVEAGAGDGTLARQLLARLAAPVVYTAVERSTGARSMLDGIEGIVVTDDLPGDPHLILAHELLDNLPFRRARMTDTGPREIRVGLDAGGQLAEVAAAPDDDVRAAAAGLEPGEETVLPDGALAFVDDAAARLRRGYVLVIDYGDVGGPGGPAHGYRTHGLVEDPLDTPGGADVTAGVDFAAVAERARERGLTAFGPVTQHRALRALGFEAWVRGELERQHRLLDERTGLEAVRTWSGRSRATLLVDPAALGRFRWLVLATPGLPAPDWLEHAQEPATDPPPAP